MKTLVLGLGNELLADDAVGIIAARRLADEIGDLADVVESRLHGLALIDILAGYDRAVIIDAIRTGVNRPGTVIELRPEEFRPTPSPSPHYTGLPEMIQLAQQLRVPFPKDIRIFAVEVADSLTVGKGPGPEVMGAVDELVHRTKRCLCPKHPDGRHPDLP